MTRKLWILPLFLLIGLAACNKEDDEQDGQAQTGTFETTVEGTPYSFNPQEGIYSDVTGKLVLSAYCEDCPYSVELQVLDGLDPRTVSSDGSTGNFGRVLITFLEDQGQPEYNADPATITIDSHNESAQRISGSFSFTITTLQNQTFNGSGSFSNVSYD